MLFGLLGSRTPPEPPPAESAYQAIVSASRRAEFYQELKAPDTLPGRFELIVLHSALCMRRLRADGGPQALQFSQEVFDAMFRQLDADMREMGVGDLAVPKRIKAMARSFFDGAVVYDIAIDASDRPALAAALRRIVYASGASAGDGPDRLADYVLRADRALSAQSVEDVVARGPIYPEVADAAS